MKYHRNSQVSKEMASIRICMYVSKVQVTGSLDIFNLL